ncbi:hypothetical protein BpHYR1_006871, partial [Brachionus plicatilis]
QALLKQPSAALEHVLKQAVNYVQKRTVDNLKELNKWLIESSIDPCDDVKIDLDSKEESNESKNGKK